MRTTWFFRRSRIGESGRSPEARLSSTIPWVRAAERSFSDCFGPRRASLPASSARRSARAASSGAATSPTSTYCNPPEVQRQAVKPRCSSRRGGASPAPARRGRRGSPGVWPCGTPPPRRAGRRDSRGARPRARSRWWTRRAPERQSPPSRRTRLHRVLIGRDDVDGVVQLQRARVSGDRLLHQRIAPGHGGEHGHRHRRRQRRGCPGQPRPARTKRASSRRSSPGGGSW